MEFSEIEYKTIREYYFEGGGKKKKEKGGGGVGCEGLERNGSRMKDVEAELLCTSCSELT